VIGLSDHSVFSHIVEPGGVAVSAGQFKTAPSYKSSNSMTLHYTGGSACGSGSSYSTTIVFLCQPGVL